MRWRLVAAVCAAIVIAIPIVALIAGVRVFVIQPIGAIPDGITVVMHGLPGLQPFDSPDAICQRTQGGVSLLCRGVTAGQIAREGTILFRLPYNDFFYALTNSPQLDR